MSSYKKTISEERVYPHFPKLDEITTQSILYLIVLMFL